MVGLGTVPTQRMNCRAVGLGAQCALHTWSLAEASAVIVPVLLSGLLSRADAKPPL